MRSFNGLSPRPLFARVSWRDWAFRTDIRASVASSLSIAAPHRHLGSQPLRLRKGDGRGGPQFMRGDGVRAHQLGCCFRACQGQVLGTRRMVSHDEIKNLTALRDGLHHPARDTTDDPVPVGRPARAGRVILSRASLGDTLPGGARHRPKEAHQPPNAVPVRGTFAVLKGPPSIGCPEIVAGIVPTGDLIPCSGISKPCRWIDIIGLRVRSVSCFRSTQLVLRRERQLRMTTLNNPALHLPVQSSAFDKKPQAMATARSRHARTEPSL